MRVLLIDGGRRPEDPCREALRRAEERLRAAGHETELFWPLYTEDLPCSGCGACRGAGMCVADPRAGAFLKAAAACGGFVLAAPMGLLGPDVHVKNLLERAVVLAARRENSPFAGKQALALPVGRQSARGERQLAALLDELGLRAPDETLAALIKEEQA